LRMWGANIMSYLPIEDMRSVTETSWELNAAARGALAARKIALEAHILANVEPVNEGISGWEAFGEPEQRAPPRCHRGTITLSNGEQFGSEGPARQFARVHPETWDGSTEEYLGAAKRMGFNVIASEVGTIVPDYSSTEAPFHFQEISDMIDVINDFERADVLFRGTIGRPTPTDADIAKLAAWNEVEAELVWYNAAWYRGAVASAAYDAEIDD
jgi:hypothetical protein